VTIQAGEGSPSIPKHNQLLEKTGSWQCSSKMTKLTPWRYELDVTLGSMDMFQSKEKSWGTERNHTSQNKILSGKAMSRARIL